MESRLCRIAGISRRERGLLQLSVNDIAAGKLKQSRHPSTYFVFRLEERVGDLPLVHRAYHSPAKCE